MQDIPYLDVRAEGEYAKGHIPGAINLPILNDQERHLVGKCYKENGQDKAVELGHQLVGGDVRNDRVEAWCTFFKNHPTAHVYCWRGGMRSKLTQEWMVEEGAIIPLIDGGYKSLRRFLIETIEDAAESADFIRVAGQTGTAKTPLLNEIKNSIDLEAHANHRGSSFGRYVSEPPTQVNFENALAIDLLRTRDACPNKTLMLEDEGRRIGAVSIPESFFNTMKKSKAVVIEMPLSFRIKRILDEYVIEMLSDFEKQYPDDAFEQFSCYLLESLSRVQKRLGLERYREITSMMEAALQHQKCAEDPSEHEGWISRLLTEYYDPMYAYQMGNDQEEPLFRGSYDEVLQWIRNY